MGGRSAIVVLAAFAVGCGPSPADPAGGGAALAADGDAPMSWGTIRGRVTYTGDVPKLSVADSGGRRRDLLHVNALNRGLRYTVVYLSGGDIGSTGATPGVERDDEAGGGPAASGGGAGAAVVDQRDDTFTPHVLAVRAGREVRFTNSDFANHNVRAAAIDPRNQFNVLTAAGPRPQLPGVGGGYTHRFVAQAGHSPVRLSCDIHAWMSGWVYVFEHPHYAVTDADGRFEIDHAPPGEHRLHIRQPDGGLSTERTVIIPAGGTVEIEVAFDEDDLKPLNSGS